MKYFITPFKKMFDVTGKSTVKEFWLFFLIDTLVAGVFGFISGIFGIGYIGDAYLIVSCLPFIALGFRRLNDAGYNKWLFLIPIANLILVSLDSKE